MIEREDLFSRMKMIQFLQRWGFKQYASGNSSLAIHGTCSYSKTFFEICFSNSWKKLLDDDLGYLQQVCLNPLSASSPPSSCSIIIIFLINCETWIPVAVWYCSMQYPEKFVLIRWSENIFHQYMMLNA